MESLVKALDERVSHTNLKLGSPLHLSQEAKRAMMSVDRADFVPKELAYHDTPIPIGHGQTISAPHMHAYALAFAQDHLKPGARVLDVGSGSGYLTTVMAKMVEPSGKVIGVEIVNDLVEQSLKNIAKNNASLLDSTIEIINQNARSLSLLDFDVIHVGADAKKDDADLLADRLKEGGVLLIPVDGLFNVYQKKNGKLDLIGCLEGVRYVPLI